MPRRRIRVQPIVPTTQPQTATPTMQAQGRPWGKWVWNTLKVVALILVVAWTSSGLWHNWQGSPVAAQVIQVVDDKDYREMKHHTLEPGRKFILHVNPGYCLDVWGTYNQEAGRDGNSITITFSAIDESNAEMAYRQYLITTAHPCDGK